LPDTVKVVPSILTDNPGELANLVRQAERFATYVQFDIMDGQFVPSHSITWQDLSALKTTLNWEAHLMVRHPRSYLPGFARAGAKKVIFHREANDSPESVIAASRELGIKVGLAVNPETTVTEFIKLADKVDSILFLSVHPGFYGSPFIPEVLDKISELRNYSQQIEIGIDGGVKENNIGRVASSGVNAIYIGSAIFLRPDPSARYAELTRLAREA
jgi:ribulose-phosphate 3-epimerase